MNSAVKTYITQDTKNKMLEKCLVEMKAFKMPEELYSGQYCHALLCKSCTANCEQVRALPGSHSESTPSRKEEKELCVVYTAAIQRAGQTLKCADM